MAHAMQLLCTPDARFDDLPDWPYEPRYADVKGARVHYVDEGQGDPVLLLHGEPTWSYLYRKMIPTLAQGHRVVAPDFLGFGRSDKPARVEDYSVRLHVETLLGLLDTLDLRRVTLVCQDWGGLIGLAALPDAAERFSRLVVMNTGLPDGTHPMSEEWQAFHEFVKSTEDLPVGKLVRLGCLEPVPTEIRLAYDAPYPDATYKAGARAFPLMVPTSPDMEGAAFMRRAREFLRGWDKPVLIAFSDGDPITRGGDGFFDRLMPRAKKERVTIEDAGHFLQEDKGEDVAERIVEFLAANPA